MNGREHRWFMFATSIGPLLGAVVAMVLLWNTAFDWADLTVLVLMYCVCFFGITAGFHRLLAHRSFKTSEPVRLLLTIGGTMAGQGPPIIWCAHHRRHHRLADKPGDPHSPHLGETSGVRGFWHSHIGWLLDERLTSDPMRYCPDLVRDKRMRWISERFVSIVTVGMIVPGLVDWGLTGRATSILTGILWGGLVRMFLVNHVTYAVNSVGHYFGRRRFETTDHSRNVSWLAVPSLGEAWHNNHHAFPRAANHGQHWYEVDLTAGFIFALEKLHVVWNVIRVDPERLSLKAAGASRVEAARSSRDELPALLATQASLAPMAQRRDDDERVSLVDVE